MDSFFASDGMVPIKRWPIVYLNESYPHFYGPLLQMEHSMITLEYVVEQFYLTKWWLCIPLSVLYVAAILGLKNFMKDRPPMKLKLILFLWNATLSLFSFLALRRFIPELIYTLSNHGLYGTVCDGSVFEVNKVTRIWIMVYAASKLLEFGDTVFIVLRKRQLIFLHYYHHISVFCVASYLVAARDQPVSRWFITVNLFVHTLMYGYFALQTVEIKMPRWVSMALTSMQITQFVIAGVMMVTAIFYTLIGDQCAMSSTGVFFSSLLIITYFVLFLNFFYQTYVTGKRAASVKKD